MTFVPSFDAYKFDNDDISNEIASNPTKLRNASLAIQLSYDWIRKNSHKIANKSICQYLAHSDGFDVPTEVSNGLITCFWPGRCQIERFRNTILYIDGAHTIDSLCLCVDWFVSSTKSKLQKKLLLFNVTGVRDVNSFLDLVNSKAQFDEALFTTNIPSLDFEGSKILFLFSHGICVKSLSIYYLWFFCHQRISIQNICKTLRIIANKTLITGPL